MPQMDETKEQNCNAYIERGWCFFEFSVSCSSNRIANADNPQVKQLLETTGMPLGVTAFFRQFGSKKFTQNGDFRTVRRLFCNVTIRRALLESLALVSSVALVMV